jgi:translation initiation factor IF-2
VISAILGDLAIHLYAPVQEVAEKCDLEYVEVSAKTGEGVKEMFETLATKLEAMRTGEFPSKETAREDYTTNVVSTARNRPERECCNIF